MPAALETKTEVLAIPVESLVPDPENPRHVITGAMVDPVAESMKLEGQKTAIKVRLLDDGKYGVIAGHIRRLAALKAGLTHLNAIVLDVTPAQAFLEAVLDNRSQSMSWLDDYLVVERMKALFPDMNQAEMAARLEVAQSTISNAQKLLKVLNQGSRDLIYQQLIISSPYVVTQRVAMTLAGQKTGSPDDSAKVEGALRVAVDLKLKEKDAQKLVKWVKAGNSPESFNHQPVPKGKAKKGEQGAGQTPGQEEAPPAPVHPGASQLEATPNPSRPTPETSASPEVSKPGPGGSASAPPAPQEAEDLKGTFQNLFWKEAAGISMVSQIRTKLKKGEKPTLGEQFILLVNFLANVAMLVWKKVLHPVLKMLWSLVKKALHILWGLLKKAARVVGKPFGKVGEKLAEYAVWGLAIAFVVWLVWNAVIDHVGPEQSLHRLWAGAIAKVESVFKHPSKAIEPTLREPQSSNGSQRERTPSSPSKAPVVEEMKAIPLPKEQPKQNTAKAPENRPASQTLHALQPAEESRGTWEGEAAALPPTVRVKDFPVQVDRNMGGTMATSRLTDLGNSENVFLMQGHDRAKILSAQPSSVNFTLNYDGGLINGGLLGGKPKISFYWEDLKAIHCNELVSGTKTLYQCGLLLSSSPKPIVIQCATTGDLEHLVSALEFYIRASGHPDAPVSGLPYVNQGMLLGDKGQVTALWAQSPADQALVNFGDYVWSVGYSDTQKAKSDLEVKLQGFTPGTHSLYVVTPAEWHKAQEDKSTGQTDSFNPQRRRIVLAVP